VYVRRVTCPRVSRQFVTGNCTDKSVADRECFGPYRRRGNLLRLLVMHPFLVWSSLVLHFFRTWNRVKSVTVVIVIATQQCRREHVREISTQESVTNFLKTKSRRG
jgi:hypothetical protein